MIFVLCIIFLLTYFGYYYVKGASEYFRNNYQGSIKKELDSIRIAATTELTEYFDEADHAAKYTHSLVTRNYKWDSVSNIMLNLITSRYIVPAYFHVLLEFFDVVHAMTKYSLISVLPKDIMDTPYPWIVVYFVSLPSSIKLGYRYVKYGCVRNHANDGAKPRNDHVCCITKKV
jgi:hypothetical protein